MTESMRMWVEIIFNISYLVVVWSMVVLMAARRGTLAGSDRPVGKLVLWAFALLALGDTGHVGFRVVAYALGGPEAHPLLVGMGALSTAYTVTVFYMLLVGIWQKRFDKPLGWFGVLLLAAGVVRMAVMAFPQNQWGALEAPYNWALFRNAFLLVQGLGVMYLIFRDAIRTDDIPFRWIGAMIAVSYAFYTPVILWSSQVPLLGMLMIPKTCAYVAIAFVAYRALYQQEFPTPAQAVGA